MKTIVQFLPPACASLRTVSLRVVTACLAAAVALGALACAGSVRAQEVEALDFASLGDGFDYTQGTFSLGWRFGTNEDITVTALGFYDDLMNGISGGHAVGIYDVQTQQLLVSATVQPTDPLTGFFRYTEVTPFVLTGGRDYYIVAVNGSDVYAVGPTDLNIDPSITFEGFAAYGGNGGPDSTVLACPTNYTVNTFHGDFGPSFKLISKTGALPTDTAAAANFTGLTTTASQGNMSIGWEFTVSQPTTVTNLGHYDDSQDGLHDDHDVAIWDAVLKTIVTETHVTTADPLRGLFRYHPAPSATLMPGHQYFIMGTSGGFDKYLTEVDGLALNPAVTYVAPAFNSDPAPLGAYFPDNIVNDGSNGFFGPNFEVGPPFTAAISASQNAISRAAGDTSTVTLSRASTASVADLSEKLVIHYKVKGPLVNGVDYAPLSGKAKIKPGETQTSFTITPLAGGQNGKLKIVIEPSAKYTPVAGSKKLKVTITP